MTRIHEHWSFELLFTANQKQSTTALVHFIKICNAVVRHIYGVMNVVFPDDDDANLVISELKGIKVND